jgi:hypothetical protein
MEGSSAARGHEGSDSSQGFRIEWIQTRHSRLVRILGVIDETRVGHIYNAMVGLGQRELTLDLSGASVLARDELELCLEDLCVRLGQRLAGVLPPATEPFRLPADG